MTSKLCSRGMILLLAASLSCAMFAQSTSSGSTPSSQPKDGEEWGGYTVHQSIEFGYRFSEQTGNASLFDTMVNLHTGPRLLEQTLSMRSLNHEGVLFDNLFVSSFGWGGDPNNALRLRMDKNAWYNLRVSFRRDQNYFDYNLLANPLNPATSKPNIPVTTSPHLFDTRRRMEDIDLTLLPQSKVTFRLGYSRNNMTGPSFSSFHEGTDVLLFQPWNTTLSEYRLGVDVKVLTRTTLSYDQFLQYYKGDTDLQLAPFASATIGGQTAELGLPINTAANQPCAVTAPNTTLVTPAGVLTNPSCSAYFSYTRNQRVRTTMPTSQFSFRSNYWKRLDVAGHWAYSWADVNSPYSEQFTGLVNRTRNRAFSFTGPISVNQISNVADIGATLHLTDSLRLSNTFRYSAYRIPQSWDSVETASVVLGAGTCKPPSCTLLTPIDPAHTATVVTPTPFLSSYNQSWKTNQTELEWDITHRVGARIGARFGDRVFHVFDFVAGTDFREPDHEYTGLFGFWARPLDNLRLNFDLERTDVTRSLTRMSPRAEQRYRFRTTYNPRPWATLSGSVNLLEQRNSMNEGADFRGHYRNYGFAATLAPRERWNFDVAYDYNDVMQNALICFNDSTPPPATTSGCALLDPGNPLLTLGYYKNTNHYFSGTVILKPIRRVTTRVGYSLTSVDGSTPQFNVLQPAGPLQYNYHQPLAAVSVDLGRNLTWNTGWNYWQYGEKSFVGPTASRYFHANNATLSLRWAF